MANGITFSRDEDFDEFQDQDRTVELIGFVYQVQAPQTYSIEHRLLKFTLSNGNSKKVQCFIWGEELINKYQSELIIDRIIHIDGAYCRESMFPYKMQVEQVVPFELVIQKSTVIRFLGIYFRIPQVQVPPRRITFQNINEANGKIIIDGYVKTKFVITSSRFENSSYGCGSITDGEYKIMVHIVNYQPINIDKGVRISVIGNVNTNSDEPFMIKCESVNDIIILDAADRMSLEELLRGVKIPRRNVSAH